MWGLGVLCYELLAGRPPWQGADEEDDSGLARLFQQIQAGDVPYPSRIDAPSRDLIAALLATEEEARLSLGQLKAHAWFREVDWAGVGAVDATGELAGPGPFKPRRVRPKIARQAADDSSDEYSSEEEEEERGGEGVGGGSEGGEVGDWFAAF